MSVSFIRAVIKGRSQYEAQEEADKRKREALGEIMGSISKRFEKE